MSAIKEKEVSFALGFIDEHPDKAAQTLEQIAPADVASFLLQIPVRYQVALVDALLPDYLAHILPLLPREEMPELLAAMQVESVVAVIRRLPEEVQAELLPLLDGQRRRLCIRMLQFARDELGAWMQVSMPVIPEGLTIREARRHLRLSGGAAEVGEYAYITDRQGHAQGRLSLAMLGSLPGSTRVTEGLCESLPMVSARMLLPQAAKLAAWHSHDEIGLVSGSGILLGILRHRDLRRALKGGLAEPDRLQGSSHGPMGALVAAYGNSIAALVGVLGPDLNAEGRNSTWQK